MCEVASCLKTYVSSPSFKILEFVENSVMCEVASCLKTYVSLPSFKILEFVENNSTGREMLIVAWLLTFLATFFKSNLCKGTIREKNSILCNHKHDQCNTTYFVAMLRKGNK